MQQRFVTKDHSRTISGQKSQEFISNTLIPSKKYFHRGICPSCTLPTSLEVPHIHLCDVDLIWKVYTLLAWESSNHPSLAEGWGRGTQYIHYKSATSHCSGEQWWGAEWSWWPNKSWSWQVGATRAAHQNMSPHIHVIISIVKRASLPSSRSSWTTADGGDGSMRLVTEFTFEKSAPMEMIM